jgi:hypothetical protein
MQILENKKIQTALIALAGYAVIAYIQREVKVIPVVGEYLPK